MGNIRLLGIFTLITIVLSCNIQKSPAGKKDNKVRSKCSNCFEDKKHYRASGTRELDAGPGVDDAATRQALDFARKELAKQIATEVMSISATIAETQIASKKTSYRENVTEAFMNTANEMITEANVSCDEAQTLKNGLFRVKICLEIKKKDFNDQVYKDNHDFFANAGIDYETFTIKLSGRVVEK
jgi:hypothetical protein